MSLGSIAVVHLYDTVKELVSHVTGSPISCLPFYECDRDNLSMRLRKLINLKFEEPNAFLYGKRYGRNWMEEYYHPENLIKYYEGLYRKVLKDGHTR